MNRLLTTLAAACGLSCGAAAIAQTAATFPNRQITIVSPFAAGGGTDALARAIAQRMSDTWKQPVVVENKLGAGGKIATQYMVKSRPDGYTLLVTNTSILHLLHLEKNPGYALADLRPLVRLADVPVVLSVSRAFKGTGFAEYVKDVRQQGKGFSWGSSGNGSVAHIIGAGLASALNVPGVHLAYKGEVPMITDLAGGHLPAAITSAGAIKPFVVRGDAQPLAATGAKRSAMFPTVPTFAELGYPELSAVGFNGLFAPAGVPNDVAQKISDEVVRIMRLPEIREQMAAQGFEEIADGLAFPKQVGPEGAAWGALIQKFGIKLE